MNWTWPSAKTLLTPPECWLREARVVLLALLWMMHGGAPARFFGSQ
jgi:hypothetical protein